MYVLFLIHFHNMYIQINACCNKYSDALRYLHKCISYIFFPCNFIINVIAKKTRFMDSIGPFISGNRTFGKISYKRPNQIQVTKARKKKTLSWYKIPISTWVICKCRNLTCVIELRKKGNYIIVKRNESVTTSSILLYFHEPIGHCRITTVKPQFKWFAKCQHWQLCQHLWQDFITCVYRREKGEKRDRF